MNNIMYIQPRRSGKTHALIEAFFNHWHTSIVIVRNEQMKNYLLQQLVNMYAHEDFFFDDLRDRIFTVGQLLPQRLNPATLDFVKNVYIDEYFFSGKKEVHAFYVTMKARNPEIEWRAWTTSDMLYSPTFLKLASLMKSDPDLKLTIHLKDEVLNEISEHYWENLLSEPTWKIVSEYEERRAMVGQKQFEIQYMGQFLEE